MTAPHSPYSHHFEIPSHTLLTDLYQLTMAQGYWKAGLVDVEACFHLSFRRLPFNGGFAVAAGLEAVVAFIEQFRFRPDDLAFLKSLEGADGTSLFSTDFLEYLSQLEITCDVDAIPEGTIIFPNEPLIRVKGPLIQAQLLESPLLALINFPTLIATKAARVCLAAKGDPVFEFGMRRAQGVDGGLTAARAAYIGGCHATSNVLAGKMFDIPIKGTHAHSWVQVFDSEQEAFNTYAKTSPNNCVLLVDTYNTIDGVQKAIETAHKLKKEGHSLLGIRLDSGDLAYLSIQARKLLDDAGLQETKIIASNELDELVIEDLKKQGAKIDTWGVGTHLVTAYNQPALDGVYKLSAIRHKGGEWEPRLKLSEQMIKVSTPGILQVRRFTKSNLFVADMIYEEGVDSGREQLIVDPLDSTRQKRLEKGLESEDLLVPVIRKGRSAYKLPPLDKIRERALSQLHMLHASIKRFLNPHQYVVGLEKQLYEKKIRLVHAIRNREES